MKSFIKLSIILLLFGKSLFAQVPGSTNLVTIGTAIVKETIGQNSNYGYGSYNIGKETVGSTSKVFRTYFDFSLAAIPTNATIQTVTVSIWNGKNGYTQKITQISSLNPSDLNSTWSAIGNGSTLHSGVAYNASNFTSSSIKTAIQGSLSGRKIIIGVLSESESTDGSNTSASISLYVEFTRPLATINYSVYNDMDGFVGGIIGVGINTSAAQKNSPYNSTATEGNTINVLAYDTGNTYGGYTYVFNDNEGPTNLSELYRQNGQLGYYSYGASPSGSHTFLQNDSGIEFVAKLKKVCNLTFSNPGRAIYLNLNTYNSSVTANVVEQNTISPGAEGYFVVDGIESSFMGEWKNSAGQSFSTITASQHDTYTPVYRIQAVPPAISFGTTIGQPVVINWTDNPNSNVTQYRIHRRVYQNGVWSADAVIATVNSGVQTYTDYEYNLGVWKQDILLEYGITAYYSVNSTWSQGGANTQVYCTIGASMQSNDLVLAKKESGIPTDYSISSYPNPFNPTTTINYQLPKDGMVTIKVYDILG
ncbi:MAG: hypothetical protein K2X69_13865, partial [Silvanigrellaceae bacterium]|nr:hypothetical protein [Silvanigrellaceae bacterium]